MGWAIWLILGTLWFTHAIGTHLMVSIVIVALFIDAFFGWIADQEKSKKKGRA